MYFQNKGNMMDQKLDDSRLRKIDYNTMSYDDIDDYQTSEILVLIENWRQNSMKPWEIYLALGKIVNAPTFLQNSLDYNSSQFSVDKFLRQYPRTIDGETSREQAENHFAKKLKKSIKKAKKIIS